MNTKITLSRAELLAFASVSVAAGTYTVTEGGLTTQYDAVSYYSKPLAYKIRYKADPDKNLKFDVGYSWFKLYSASDRISNLASIPTAHNNINSDQTGRSGGNIGSEFDIRF